MALSLNYFKKERIMKLFSILFVCTMIVSCATTKNTAATADTTETASKPERNIQLKSSIGEFTDSEPFTIHSVRREGNLLFVDVSFTGGCGVHNFKMIGNQAIMKSIPAKRSVMIAHAVHREECKDVVKKTLEIDISALAMAQTPGSEIVLILKGWDKEISYIFE